MKYVQCASEYDARNTVAKQRMQGFQAYYLQLSASNWEVRYWKL